MSVLLKRDTLLTASTLAKFGTPIRKIEGTCQVYEDREYTLNIVLWLPFLPKCIDVPVPTTKRLTVRQAQVAGRKALNKWMGEWRETHGKDAYGKVEAKLVTEGTTYMVAGDGTVWVNGQHGYEFWHYGPYTIRGHKSGE